MFIALDRHGLRPLSLGKMNDAIIVASETCALNAVDAVYWRDVEPGEWLLIDENGIQSGNFAQAEQRALCSFEMIYFARADSRINGKSVLATRKELGRALAREHPAEVDMVVAAPESSVPAALGYAQQLNIPYELGLIRNPYVGRTFIEPTAELRELAARLKLSAAQDVIEGKRVALVDDSIVRGGTSKRIVRLLRDAGAKEVHVRISSPKVVKPCYYGINISDREELLANKLKEERAMAQWMGADSLAFLSEQGLARALAMGETDGSHHCFACFNGVYPTELHEK